MAVSQGCWVGVGLSKVQPQQTYLNTDRVTLFPCQPQACS